MEQKDKLTTDQISELVRKTDKNNPKEEDLKAIRKLLDQDSSLVEANEVSTHALNRVIDNYASTSGLMKELLERQVEAKRKAMDYQSTNVFVRMLIDQVILNYIRLNQLEVVHLAKLTGSHSSEHGIYWDKRLSSAQRRFTRACESLAKVKKLLVEADLKELQSKSKRSQGTLNSMKIYKILENASNAASNSVIP